MPAPVKPIPEGYHSITPYLTIRGASKAIEFYKKAFGAVEMRRISLPGDMVGHAELRIGDSVIMLSDEFPDMGGKSPQALNGSPVAIHIYTENCDEMVKQAQAAGAKMTRPVEDHFYGDRSGTLTDPFGHSWYVSTRVENMSDEEMQRRAREFMQKQGSSAA